MKRKPFPQDEETGLSLRDYDDAKLSAVARVVSVMVSSGLPTTSMLVLYYVQTTPARLGVVLVFSVLFSDRKSVV